MSSANSFLSSASYHSANARYTGTQTSSSSAAAAFNILSTNVQQQLNDLNSTRSSTSSCSTSHCLSNQCIECTTILSTRPVHSRYHLNSYLDQSSTSSRFVQNRPYVSHSMLDDHPQMFSNDDQQTTPVLSMNIPVDETDSQNENPTNSSMLNIEIEEERDGDDQTHVLHDDNCQNEQLEVFVGFYRPGEYQQEMMEEEDDDQSEGSQKSDTPKKEEQSFRELISDEDDGNEDQDFIDEDFGPNQDEDTDQQQQQEMDITNDEQFNPNILEHDQHQQHEMHEHILFPLVLVQIDEDEDQGFGAQFNDDCPSSDDENNHLSTISLNNHENDLETEGVYSKKKLLQRSQSDSRLYKKSCQTFLSLPSLSLTSENHFEKIEHIIIDDQQPTTTMSNLIIKKKQDDDNEYLFIQKKKILRKSSEEIIEISHHEVPSQTTVDEAVRDVERHVMLWDDDRARQIDDQSSLQQIVQYFQVNIDIHEDQRSRISSVNNELLLDYLQYRSEMDVSASDLYENLLQYPEFSSRVQCRFFPFWPPRDVDLLQWLSHWIKQGALPVAIMNIDRSQSPSHNSSWQHRIIYGVKPRGIYLMNPTQIQSPQKVYEQLTVDAITHISRQAIVQRYNQSPMCLTPLAKSDNHSGIFADRRWRTLNVLGQVVNVLREDRQSNENETRNIPYRPTVTHVRIPSACSSGILIFSKNYHQLADAMDLPLRQ